MDLFLKILACLFVIWDIWVYILDPSPRWFSWSLTALCLYTSFFL